MARLITKHVTTETAPEWVADSTEEVDMDPKYWTREKILMDIKQAWRMVGESMEGEEEEFDAWLDLFITLRETLKYAEV